MTLTPRPSCDIGWYLPEPAKIQAAETIATAIMSAGTTMGFRSNSLSSGVAGESGANCFSIPIDTRKAAICYGENSAGNPRCPFALACQPMGILDGRGGVVLSPCHKDEAKPADRDDSPPHTRERHASRPILGIHSHDSSIQSSGTRSASRAARSMARFFASSAS